jgi:DNA-binding beta-propeller fold protein YncE
MTRVAWAALLLAAVLSAACSSQAPSPAPARPAGSLTSAASQSGTGIVRRSAPTCTTATQSAPSLPASATHMTSVGSSNAPFGVAVTAAGHWAFASLGSGLGVFRLSAGRAPALVRRIALPQGPSVGAALSADGQLLLIAAGGSSAVVVSVPAAESGRRNAVLGVLTVPGDQEAGAIEVAFSPDGRYAFVSLEDLDQIAVFNLAKALTSGFGSGVYVGSIPTQVAPVGLAFSPDGRWLYATSEVQNLHSQIGTLAVISVRRAESDPGSSVLVRVPAGCNPVRVVTSANGSVVWVTARASDALLAFSAAALRTSPKRALLADIRVGEAPVGLALVRGGSLVVVADSDRFNATGQKANLAVVDVRDALARRPALLGYLPAGGFPRDVAANADGTALLLANYTSGQVESVDVADLP